MVVRSLSALTIENAVVSIISAIWIEGFAKVRQVPGCTVVSILITDKLVCGY